MNKKPFEEAYSKTTYYIMHYKDTGLDAFSWIEEHKRYVWNDVQCSWEVWQQAQKVAVPEPTNEVICAIENTVQNQLIASGITSDPFRLDGENIYKAIIEAQEKGNE